jgi:hypothetical protein
MKTILTALASVSMVLMMSGCFQDLNKVYDGPLQVEFVQYYQPGAPQPTDNRQYHSTVTFAHNAPATQTATLPLKLQLIGPHQGSAHHINIGVVEERPNAFTGRPAAHTAQEGVHYAILNQDARAVFPANSSFATVELEARAEHLAPGQQVHVQLALEDGDVLIPAANYRYYTVTIRRAAAP